MNFFRLKSIYERGGSQPRRRGLDPEAQFRRPDEAGRGREGEEEEDAAPKRLRAAVHELSCCRQFVLAVVEPLINKMKRSQIRVR